MTFFKITQLLSKRARHPWSRFLILPLKDNLRSYSAHRGQKNNKSPIFLTCALVSTAALTYSFNKSKETKFPTLKEICNFFVPTVSAASLNTKDIGENVHKYNFIADVVEICSPSVVLIEVFDSSFISLFSTNSMGVNGSGFIVSDDGLILTNAHIVMKRPNMSVRVRLVDGTTCNAVVECVDRVSDLATLRIDKKNLPFMKLGSSKSLRSGEFVVAIGSPLTLSNSITSGVVSSPNRRSAELGMSDKEMSYIQTDALITYGNSGGPLVNLAGEVIGINAMKLSTGISFAIPVDYAKEFLKKAEAKRKQTSTGKFEIQEFGGKRFLGITMLTLTPEIIFDLQQLTGRDSQYVKHGVLIWKVLGGSPAQIGGLKSGDVITEVNGEKVTSSENVYKALEKSEYLLLTVVRDEQILQFKIKPQLN